MKSRKTGRIGIMAIIAAMMGGKAPKKTAPKWQGVMKRSVALTNHRGACNPVRQHTEKQANARRRKQLYGSYRY